MESSEPRESLILRQAQSDTTLPVQVFVENEAVAENQVIPVHASLVVGCWFVFLAVSGLQKQSRHTKGDLSSVVKVAQGVRIAFSFKS